MDETLATSLGCDRLAEAIVAGHAASHFPLADELYELRRRVIAQLAARNGNGKAPKEAVK
jgi:hypothetical protein